MHGPTGRQRLGVSAVVPRGALTAGQGQWLGVVVSPMHDVLDGSQLRMSLAQHGSPNYGVSTGYAGNAPTIPYQASVTPDITTPYPATQAQVAYLRSCCFVPITHATEGVALSSVRA